MEHGVGCLSHSQPSQKFFWGEGGRWPQKTHHNFPSDNIHTTSILLTLLHQPTLLFPQYQGLPPSEHIFGLYCLCCFTWQRTYQTIIPTQPSCKYVYLSRSVYSRGITRILVDAYHQLYMLVSCRQGPISC